MLIGGSSSRQGLLHSFTLELKLDNSRTHSWVKLGYTVDGRAQVELNWKRVYAPGSRPLTLASASTPMIPKMGQPMVGRCRLTVSKPELKARLVAALETKL